MAGKYLNKIQEDMAMSTEHGFLFMLENGLLQLLKFEH
jgi:hypothetical protein